MRQIPIGEPARRAIRRRTIISFAFFALFILVSWTGWRFLYKAPAAPGDRGIPAPLRKVHSANEQLFAGTFNEAKLAKTYLPGAAEKKVRVNGSAGMSANFDPAAWKLHVARAPGDTLLLTMEDIKKLPNTDIIFDFKCIEGWSQITHWGGVKLSDFIKAYHLEAQTEKGYLGLRTPDDGYYVGIDMPSAIHPQTILCYEMNGKPLPLNQGAPLRLIIPVKYGIKHLKRIGTMFFSDQRPRDYWAEQGYDYYSGH